MTGTISLGVAIIAGMLGSAGVSLPTAPHGESAGPDLSTIDAAIEGLYASISGPKGQERDWEMYDAVFAENARMGAVVGAADGETRFIEMTPDDYKAQSGPFLVTAGFTEKETHRVLEVYGTVAHAWSSYHGTFVRENGVEGTVTGINSIQLVKQDGQWRVTSIQWESTDTAGDIPAKYLD